MGRDERRKNKDKTKPKTYVMTEEQIEFIKKMAAEEAIKNELDKRIASIKAEATENVMALMLSVPIVILRDKFAFGRIRIDRFLGYATTWIKAINNDSSTLKELIQIAYDEAGYEVEGFQYDKRESKDG